VAGACTIDGSGVVTFNSRNETCVIEATAAGNGDFNAVTVAVTQTIEIGTLNQTITFNQPANVPFGSSSRQMTATASSGLSVDYAPSSQPACDVAGTGVVTIKAVGACTVTARQAGDSQYAPASNVTRVFQVVPAPPTAPTLTFAAPSSQSITVGFTAPGFTGGVSITSYELVATVGGVAVATETCVGSPCTIGGLVNGTNYQVKVAGINVAGPGPYSTPSGPIAPYTNANAVGALTPTPGDTVMDLTWIPLTNDQLGGGTFTRYEVFYRNPAVTSTWTKATDTLTNQNTSSFQVTGLVNGTSYDFQVVAITSAFPGEVQGNTAQVVQYPSTVPSRPLSLAVLATTATDVQFSWSAPLSDGGSPLTNPNYTVTVSGPGVLANACDPGPTGTSCTVSGLENSAVYAFSVVANNRMGPSLAATETYVVPSSDASLSNLVVTTAAGAAVLTPVFAAGTFEYTSSVTNAVASVTVTPITNDPGATVTVDAEPVISGEASDPIALAVGVNTITVVVTASDPRSSQTYTLTITRAAAPITPSGGGAGGVSPGIPVVPPASVMSGAQVGAVTVNGVMETDVVLVRTPTNSGWEVMAPDFTLSVDTEAPTGALEPLLPSGVMQVPQGGLIAVNATGYAPDSTLAMFAIPRSDLRQVGRIAARSMANAVWLGSVIVAANGSARLTVAVPASLSTGDYVLQLNGETDQAQLRSVNLQLVVEPGVQMRAATVTGAAFFEGRSATLSAAGEMRLRDMVASIPAGASDVTVSVVGVSVSRETPRENLRLARERAEQISDYLIEQGVAGNYRVSVFTEFTIESQPRSVSVIAGNVLMESPMTSSAGKPLTTASISFEAPTQPLQ
jgi:outer membrane protein OmpA-like peptidoglycan-associated protein